MISEWGLALVQRGLTKDMFQRRVVTPLMRSQFLAGVVRCPLVFEYRPERTVFLCTERGDYTGKVHLFTEGRLWGACRAMRAFKRDVWARTPWTRLEFRTHVPAVRAMATRCGAQLIGTARESYMTLDGLMVDETLFELHRENC